MNWNLIIYLIGLTFIMAAFSLGCSELILRTGWFKTELSYLAANAVPATCIVYGLVRVTKSNPFKNHA